MILPKDVKTRHKIRDAKILQLFYEGANKVEIAQQFEISHQRVGHIIRKNIELLEIDKTFERIKRHNRLQKIFLNTPDTLSPKKDILNVIQEMRHELEGEGNINIISQFFSISADPKIKTRLSDALHTNE